MVWSFSRMIKMNEIQMKFLKLIKYKNLMNDQEKSTFMSNLMFAYVNQSCIDAIDLLLNDDFEGYKKLSKETWEVGAKLKESLSNLN